MSVGIRRKGSWQSRCWWITWILGLDIFEEKCDDKESTKFECSILPDWEGIPVGAALGTGPGNWGNSFLSYLAKQSDFT